MDASIPMTQFNMRPPPGSPPSMLRSPHFLTIEESGQVVLWIGFFIFVLSTLLIAFLASRVQVKHRALHYITLIITGVSSLSYYAMATGSGALFLLTDITDGAPVYRLVYQARYADWAITVPLVLLDLALLAGLPWVDVVLLLVAGDAAVACTFAAPVYMRVERVRWGWYIFTLIFLGLVFLILVLKGRKCAKRQHTAVTRLYTTLTVYTVSIGVLYLIMLALGIVTRIIDPNTEVIVETILDILAKAVFGILLLVVHKHESEDAGPAKFSKAWLEPRGTRGGIHLPGSDS